MGNEEMGPPWLKPLLKANYFVPCPSHGDSNKSECNMYCLDCMGNALCSYCLIHHKDHHVIQLSIRAAGVGLTLTAASTVIFAELSWTPGDIIQAEDCVHRIGQVSSVNIYYLLANDTVNDIIWDVVQSKLENLGQILDGHENSLEVTSQSRSSPAKQKILYSFIKRCNNTQNHEHEPKLKYPRY